MCATGDEKEYEFSVSIKSGRYHVVGVAAEACCADVSTYHPSAALYSHTAGWNRDSVVREVVEGHSGWSFTDHACHCEVQEERSSELVNIDRRSQRPLIRTMICCGIQT